jgi:hypothetical protein
MFVTWSEINFDRFYVNVNERDTERENERRKSLLFSSDFLIIKCLLIWKGKVLEYKKKFILLA